MRAAAFAQAGDKQARSDRGVATLHVAERPNGIAAKSETLRNTIAIKGMASTTIRTGAVKNIIPLAHPVFGAASGADSSVQPPVPRLSLNPSAEEAFGQRGTNVRSLVADAVMRKVAVSSNDFSEM